MKMDEQFIRNRITELRLRKDVSEYQMSLDLGKNKSYIQGISSGRSMPSMRQFLEICEYFEITPAEFFQVDDPGQPLVKKAARCLNGMNQEDLEALMPLLSRLNQSQQKHEI